MHSHPPVIQLDGLCYRYSNGLEALADVSLSLSSGEIIAIVGPSGCGKSTLLNLVSGLLQPTLGRILIDGDAVADRRGRFSYMPQRDCLLPWRTAAGNAALLLEVAGRPKQEARSRALAMLDDLDLGEFVNVRPVELSGGMRQRVALIRTVLPGLNVLLDEPFGALDAITRLELQEWLMTLQARTGLSMLLVTHDVEEALLLSDRVFVMSARPGRIMSVHDVPFARPRWVALVGEPEFARLKSDLLISLRASLAAGSGRIRAA